MQLEAAERVESSPASTAARKSGSRARQCSTRRSGELLQAAIPGSKLTTRFFQKDTLFLTVAATKKPQVQ